MAERGRVSNELKLSAATLQQPVGIVTARWNQSVTGPLRNGALEKLQSLGFSEKHIFDHEVPGSFELPLGVQLLAEQTPVKGIVAIGCLIKGETPHFDYIAQAVTEQLSRLNLFYSLPVGYGILTVYNQDQAEARAGGDAGNKGIEAVEATLEMMELRQSLKNKRQQAGF